MVALRIRVRERGRERQRQREGARQGIVCSVDWLGRLFEACLILNFSLCTVSPGCMAYRSFSLSQVSVAHRMEITTGITGLWCSHVSRFHGLQFWWCRLFLSKRRRDPISWHWLACWDGKRMAGQASMQPDFFWVGGADSKRLSVQVPSTIDGVVATCQARPHADSRMGGLGMGEWKIGK